MGGRIKEMRKLIHHSLNILHLYCRMVDVGLKKETAAKICRFLEGSLKITKLIYI